MAVITETNRVASDPYTAKIPAGDAFFYGDLSIPENAKGVVVCMQEIRHTQKLPRGNPIVDALNKHKFASLLMEIPSYMDCKAVETSVMIERLKLAAAWVRENAETKGFPVGYFAAGSGSIAALSAAGHRPDRARAVVALDGRPGQAAEFLPLVKVPVLLLAGGRDPEGLRSAQAALKGLNGDSALNVIPQASQAFSEPGVLEDAAALAALWFAQHMEQ